MRVYSYLVMGTSRYVGVFVYSDVYWRLDMHVRSFIVMFIAEYISFYTNSQMIYLFNALRRIRCFLREQMFMTVMASRIQIWNKIFTTTIKSTIKNIF